MSNFWSSLFGGSNSSLSKDLGTTDQIAGFAAGTGESNITAGSNFEKALLSGDSSKVSQALAPVISADKTMAQQGNKTTAEFGTRSGGNAASTAATSDKVHSDITKLIGSLTGNAAGTLLSSGSTLLAQGEGATMDNAKLSQQQMENWSKSILGKGITGVVSAAESFGIGGAEGAATGAGFSQGAYDATLGG